MKSTLSGASVATAAFYWLVLARYIFSHPLTFNLFVASFALPLLHFSAGSIYLGLASVSHLAISVFILNARQFMFDVIMIQLGLNLSFCFGFLLVPSLSYCHAFSEINLGFYFNDSPLSPLLAY
jgi:TRAP-type C4-dicarboxylate transport system permease small subunit